MKEMPERIYLFDCNDAMTIPLEGDTEYIRKDFFIKKACKWIKTHICVFKSVEEVDMFKDLFKKAMEEQV